MRINKNGIRKIGIILLGVIIILLVLMTIYYWYPKYKPTYRASDFGIEVIQSKNDTNQNGIDDYTDIVIGARIEAEAKPKYKSAYYAGGYPPDDEGVCTDTVWRALKNAGIILKDLVDKDIKEHIESYPRVDGKQDRNIDFRRVKNLKVFFDRYAIHLTTDPYDIKEWMPGDIVIFSTSHIGIISDKRNKQGIPYLIHNAGQPLREEDALIKWHKKSPITGHYRFDYQRYLELSQSDI